MNLSNSDWSDCFGSTISLMIFPLLERCRTLLIDRENPAVQENSPMLVSFQYWARCSPMDFSRCRYSLASAKSCLLWVGSRTKYGTSTTPTTPPQALKHTNQKAHTAFSWIQPNVLHYCILCPLHVTHVPPSSWGPVFSYILMRREQLYTNIPSRSLCSMFTPNIKLSSLGSFKALKK